MKTDEEKLGNALIGRGLVSRDEYKQFLAAPSDQNDANCDSTLGRLVGAGLLTAGQAKRLAPELPALMNQHIPGYQLLEKLGQGSMGTVFKARQLSMNRLVAVKVLLPRLAANPEFIERFHREAHLAAKFSSNNVVQAIDVGSTAKVHYFVMEYVEGVTIKEELDRGKVYQENEAIDIVLQIAQALQHAHRRNLLHRDIKPANIILTPEGIAKLADLGMARGSNDQASTQAEVGMTIGTPYYIAPEQINSRGRVDNRADLYSLGATLYHMVTGKPPFPYQKVDEVLRAHLMEELTPPDHINTKLSSGIGEVVEFLMAKKRDDRYPSPAELIIDLECLLHGEPPKIARRRLEAATLEGLAEGEVAEDEDRAEKRDRGQELPAMVWVYVLAAALGISLLLNLILLLRSLA
ncbi:MAG: serine/threonine protein kinase [Planctomycetes bacterium]|nr:serine/threonine protein kinase [Planctomycetota bacterium]